MILLTETTKSVQLFKEVNFYPIHLNPITLYFLQPIAIYVGFCLALEQKAYCCCMVTISALGVLQLAPMRRIVNGDYYRVWFVTPVCEQTPRIFRDRQEKQTSGSTFFFFFQKNGGCFPPQRGWFSSDVPCRKTVRSFQVFFQGEH